MTVAGFGSALLVEDELNLAIPLEIALKKLGMTVDRAMNLHEAEEKLGSRGPYDFVLLDRKLPDGDGLTLCKKLRAHGFGGSVLVLTASGTTEDRITGLNDGADDYLPKPFSWEELEARIRALARRQNRTATQVSPAFRSGPSWDLDESRLRINGPKGWVELTPLEFKLAAQLIRSEGTIVTRDHLLKNVWGFTLLPKTRTVDHFLGRLRKLFETNPDEPRHFLTVRGAGYRFEK